MAYTRDEKIGQRRVRKQRMAGDALLEEGQTRSDLTAEQKEELRANSKVTHRGREGSQFYNKQGNLTDITEKNNPFTKDLDKFDLSAFGRGASKGKDMLNAHDVTRLMKEGGHTAEEVYEQFKDSNIAVGAMNLFKRKGIEMSGGQDTSDPEETTPAPTPAPAPAPAPSPTPAPGGGGGSSTTNTQEQNVTQDNDITTTINGDGNTVTNEQDNSVTQNSYGGGSNYQKRLAQGMAGSYIDNLLNR